jgi:hypothetical protein
MTAFNALTNGRGHRLCLKSGATLDYAYAGLSVSTNLDGKNDRELLMITSYDGSGNVPALSGSRPIITCPNSVDQNGIIRTTTSDYIAFVGLEVTCPQQNPDHGDFNDAQVNGPLGISIGNGSIKYALVEDCKISFVMLGINAQATGTGHIQIRRNIIHNCYGAGSAHSQGLFANRVSYLLVEDNFFYHNGWNDTATNGRNTGDTRTHNLYIDADEAASTTSRYEDNSYKAGRSELVGNIFLQHSAQGTKINTSGRVADCLYAKGPFTGYLMKKTGIFDHCVTLQGVARAGVTGNSGSFRLIHGAPN